MRSKLKVLVAVFLMAAMVFTMFPASAIAGPKGKGNHKPGKTVEETQAPETEVVETEAPTEEVETETVIETEAVETEAVETVQETEPPVEETEAAYPARTFEGEDKESGISVTVDAPEGALPAEAEMKLTALTKDQLAEVSEKVDGNLVEAIDISFWNGDQEIEPLTTDSPIIVTMSSAKIAEVEDPTVVHIPDDDAEVEEVNQVEDAAAANEVVFEADSFSVYAVVANSFSVDQQYVIYSGTTALAYNGNNLTTATVTVEDNTVVRSSSDNIVWTVTSSTNQGGETYYRLSTGSRYLQYQRQNNTDSLRTTGTEGNDGTTWNYDSYNNRLYAVNGNRTRYLTYNNGTWGLTQTASQAATVYIARVSAEPASGDLTYYYYNADHSASIASSETAETLTNTWTDVSTLAKTIPGYKFLEARANSVDGDIIIQVNNRSYRTGTSGSGSTLNNIYFIYMKDYVAGEDIIPGLKGPETEKTVTQNPDGTFTIRLDITGVVNNVKHGANVVIVFDRTYSMRSAMSNSDSTMRINAAISAVNTMVTTLNPGTGAEQNDIDFALVEFDRNAAVYDFGSNGITGHTEWTKSGSALTTRVGRYQDGNNLAASGQTAGAGGTNWQAALQKTAAVLENKPDADPTYVVFMTDGEPTIYIGSDTVNTNRTVNDPEYTRSVPYATAIVDADYLMYDIFCSASETALLESLYTASGAEDYVEAETQKDIEDAFKAVANAMLDAIGSSDVATDDGVPELGDFELATVDGQLQLSDARYYKNGEPWADAPVATPSSGGVKWDLSSVGTLVKDTVYSIEFEIWPSQEAYDLIADLNNGLRSYKADGENPITDDERAQITKVSDTEYTLKTNTYLKTSYKLYGATHTDDIDFTEDAMDLPTKTVSVKKLWPENLLDKYGAAAYRDKDGKTQYAEEIKLTLERGGESYMEITVSKDGPDGINEGTYTDPDTGEEHDYADDNWSMDNIYISCGFMTVETVDGQKVAHVKEPGHDYQIIEPEAFLYYWDLISDVYRPMVINGTPTLLVYDQDATEEDVDNVTYFMLEEPKEGEQARVYKKHSDTDNTLEANNYRRSNLNLTKVVPAEDENAWFTYSAVVEDSYSTDERVWFSAFEPVIGEDGKPSKDEQGNIVYTEVYDDWVISGATKEESTLQIGEGAASNVEYHEADDDHPYNYFTYTWNGGSKVFTVPAVNDDTSAPVYYTGYWYAENGATVTFKIKGGTTEVPGWNVRFLNLYHDSTYTFTETGMPNNYDFDSISSNAEYEFIHEASENWNQVEETVASGTIPEPNNNYYVTYTNKVKPEFYIYHSGVAGDGNLETIPMTDVNADGTYNLYEKTTPGTLYGGYYLDYEGKGDYKDDGVPGTTGVVYSGMNYQDWASCKPQTVDGEKMTPVAGETYYIKEVPTYYLRNYHQITYVKSTGKLTALYLISAIDDLNYNETGLTFTDEKGTESKIVNYLTFLNTATNKSVTLKADTVFKSIGITGKGSDKEYLTYWDATSSEFFAEGSFKVHPYWITPDSITVHGISTRTITIDETMTKSGISKKDD